MSAADPRHVVHSMVSIAEIERLLQPRCLQELACVMLMGRDGFIQSEAIRVFLIIAGPDEISAMTLLGEFGHLPQAKNGPSSR